MEFVASTFAVVSLSLQILDKIHSLYGICESVQGAPKFVLDLVKELRLLEIVLQDIRKKEKHYGQDEIVGLVLQSLNLQLDELLAVVAKHLVGTSSGSRITNTWNNIKVSMKKEGINELRLALSNTKTTLVVARFNLSERINLDIHDRTVAAITTGFAHLQAQNASGTVSTQSPGLPDIQRHVEDLQKEMRRVSAAVTQPWIQSCIDAAIEKSVKDVMKQLHTAGANVQVHTDDTSTQQERDQASRSPASDMAQSGPTSAQGSRQCNSDSKNRRMKHLVAEKFEGSYASITSTIFGTIYVTTDQFYVKESIVTDEEEAGLRMGTLMETNFAFYPARWLVWWGLKYAVKLVVSRDNSSWKNNLQTFYAVPDNSLVFQFCEQGNVSAVNTLFTSGRASPWDTNSKGWTPLHIAAWHCDIDMIKMLLQAGANRETLTFDFPNGNYEQCSPLVTAATISSTITVPKTRRMESLRLLSSDLDFSDHESQAWKMVLVLLERERASTGLCTTTEVSEWILDRFLAEMRENHSPQLLAWLMIFTLETPNLLRRILEIDEDAAHTSFLEGAYTPMHGKIAEDFPESIMPGIELLLKGGADPHRVGKVSVTYGGDDSGRLDTLTSIAMRRSSAFSKWRRILHNLGYDLREFVAQEMQREPLVALGWTEESLLRLLECAFPPLELDPDLCEKCGRVVYHTFDKNEMWWERLLDDIRAFETNSSSYLVHEQCTENQAPEDVSFTSFRGEESCSGPDLCWKCAVMQRVYGDDYERDLL